MLLTDDDEEELPRMQVMAGVFISITKPVSAQRIRERMQIEKMDTIVSSDAQNFEALMKDFQKYHDKASEDDSTAFPEAIFLQRYGSPGAQGSWWHVYNW